MIDKRKKRQDSKIKQTEINKISDYLEKNHSEKCILESILLDFDSIADLLDEALLEESELIASLQRMRDDLVKTKAKRQEKDKLLQALNDSLLYSVDKTLNAIRNEQEKLDNYQEDEMSYEKKIEEMSLRMESLSKYIKDMYESLKSVDDEYEQLINSII